MGYGHGERRPTAGLGPISCPKCGDDFQPYRRSQVYCSRKCRDGTAKAKARAKAWRSRPDVRERQLAYRRMETTPDIGWLKALNLKSALRKYGVTLEWFTERLDAQGGACILCGHVPPEDAIKAASRLHVDHDHGTGAVRDLLCTCCNMGIGYFRDDPDLMRRAAEYIERHRCIK